MSVGRSKPRRDRHHPYRSRLQGFGYFQRLGPGLITGAADDDPAGIGTYSQVGVMYRFDLAWTAIISLPWPPRSKRRPRAWGSPRDEDWWR